MEELGGVGFDADDLWGVAGVGGGEDADCGGDSAADLNDARGLLGADETVEEVGFDGAEAFG